MRICFGVLKLLLNDFLGREDLVLIFDTFEQVAIRGPEVMQRFATFIELVLSIFPQARVVISGRGQIALPLDMQLMRLADLDPTVADAVLEALGVADEKRRSQIGRIFGGNPLLLRLAGEAYNSGKLSLDDLARFEAEARSLRVQGLLYTRILGHIRDPEIERLAHPGLVVRRVTADVIRVVLAEVCDIDPARAEVIFARLPNQIDLFEPAFNPAEVQPGDPLADQSALGHRQDLREAVLEVMGDDPRWRNVLPQIHRRASIYYQERAGAIARAEQLYHLLMLDADPEELDQFWDDALAPSLGRSWAEPFPARARAWLALRLGFDWNAGDGLDVRLADWEIRAARIARARLDVGDAKGALEQLHERRDRTPTSPVTPLEAQALAALNRPEEALDAIEGALMNRSDPSPAYVLALHLLAADIASSSGQLEQAKAHAKRAASLAIAAKDVVSKLRALEVLTRVTGSPDQERELERTFVEAPERQLRADEETASRVVRTIGSQSDAVIRKAAMTFGDLPKQTLLTNDLGIWTSLFKNVGQREGGEQLLELFAPRIGLPSTEQDPLAFATGVIQYGRRGEALSTILDAFGDDRTIRSGSLATFTGVTCRSTWLSDQELHAVYNALISLNLFKSDAQEAMRSKIMPAYAAMLPISIQPGVQLTLTLNQLNGVHNLVNGDVPLAQFLEVAALLGGGRTEAGVIEQALEKVRYSRPVPASAPTIASGGRAAPLETASLNTDVELQAQTGALDLTVGVRFLRDGVAASASVAKLLVHRHSNGQAEFLDGDEPKLGNGTGWIIAPRMLITNFHVVNARRKEGIAEPNASNEDFRLQAEHTQVLFDYVTKDVPTPVCTEQGSLLYSNEELDFALLRLPAGMPPRRPLRLRTHAICKTTIQALGLGVNLLQHPNGDPMRLGFRNNYVVLGDDQWLSYLTDTAVGSSGSPVCDDAWLVAALHSGSRPIGIRIDILGQQYRRENYGIPITTILAHLKAKAPALHDEVLTGQQVLV